MALFRIGTALDSFILYRRVLAIIDVYMCECIRVFEHVHFSTCPCPILLVNVTTANDYWNNRM